MEKIFDLKYPFEIESEGLIKTVTQLKLKRLKVKDLKNFSPDNFKQLTSGVGISQVVPILALMNNMSVEELDQLDMADITNVIEEIGNFF
jgi:hypothetical protein